MNCIEMFLSVIAFLISVCCNIEDNETSGKRKRKADQRWAVEQRNVRSKQAKEQALIRSKKDAQRKADNRAKESADKTKERRRKEAKRVAEKRKRETEQDRNVRNEKRRKIYNTQLDGESVSRIRNANTLSKRQSRKEVIDDKKNYLKAFNAEHNGPLYEQEFVKQKMQDFQDTIYSYNQHHCIICKELWPIQGVQQQPYTCSRCSKESPDSHKFGKDNDMIRDMTHVPPEIALELRKLTMVEEMLLSPVHPIMSVYRLPSGGNVSRGYVANFKQDSVTFIKQIPLKPSELPCMIIRRQGQQNTSADFKVCRARVEAVGRFLVDHHPGLKTHSVTFNEQQCASLPENGILEGIEEIVHNEEQQSGDEGAVPRETLKEDCLPADHAYVEREEINRTEEEKIRGALNPEPTISWPTIDPNPINEFEHSGLASLAFVKLFPLGQADPTRQGRLLTVTEVLASSHLLKFAEIDPLSKPTLDKPSGSLYYPFAEHERFSFWMVDRIRRHRALSQCKVYLKQNPSDECLSMAELKAMAKNGKIDELLGRLHAYTANVVGSDAYWSKKRRELEAIMQQKGLGTAFFTFSFADNHWEDLHRLMPGGALEPKDRYKDIAKNPHLADWYFSERLGHFIKYFFQGVLDSEWIWHRYEWQSRTSIHAHGVVKLKNDPGIAKLVAEVYAGTLFAELLKDEEYVGTLSEEKLAEIKKQIEDSKQAERRVLTYTDTLLSAVNDREPSNEQATVPVPHPCSKDVSKPFTTQEESDTDYCDLVNCFQRHVCRPDNYCKSKKGGTGCRFNYPIKHEEESKITFEKVGESVRAKIVLKRNDSLLNVHNRVMLQGWRANVDLQIILDAHAAMAYMVKYATKGEKAGRDLRSTIRTIVDRADESDSVASAIRSSVIKSVGQRDIGKGECSRILFSGSHVESTFKYVYVSTDLETQEIVRSSRTGNLSKSKSLLQCFAERHNLQESHPTLDLDQPNLIEFCKQFVLVKGELRKNPDADKTIVITFPNFRYAPKSPQYKQFCRSSLLKYSPWTATTVTVIKNDITVVEQWESFVATCSENQRKYFNTDLELKKMLKTVLDDIHLDDVEEEVTRKQELWQKISNMRPPIENASPQLDPIVDKTFDWIKDTVIEYLPSFLTTAPQWIQKNSTSISNPSELLKELPVVYRDSLNERQRKWYDLVIDRYKSSTPLRLIVTGTAGTGKSHTISAISHAIPPENLIRSAFTAQAAFQIRGSTLHKTFHLPVESGGRQFDLLNGEAAANLEKEFSKVKVVIIDEFSMLSQPILGKIDKRLKQAKGNSEPFGGVSVILVGDPAQLPPVGGTPLHGSIEKDFGGKAAYQSFKHVIKLEEIKRQAVKEGDFEQQRFVDILSELREGRCSLEDWQFLQKRNPESIPDFEVRYADAVRLFSTNEKVDEYNTRKLNQLKKPITLIKAKNSTKTARSLASDKFRGLKNDLYLAVGAKVTLVTNLWSSCGLTNGGKGTIVDIVYPTGSQPNIDQPSFIVVHFPEFTGPQFFPVDQDHEYWNCIPVAPVTIFTDDYRHSRTQFPLRLAYAMTIHKAQGKTLEQVVVDLGATEMTQGLTFVALSRVTHINSLCIIDHSYERLKRLANSETLRPRKEEEARLNALAVNTLLLI